MSLRRVMAVALALSSLLLCTPPVAARSALPPWWPWHQNDTIDGTWAHTLNQLWNSSQGSIGFCLGRSQVKAQRLMGLSFPWPLPLSSDPKDAVCSNRLRLEQHLCSPLELEHMFRFELMTEDLEKVPDTLACTAGGAGNQPACAPGFLDACLENRMAPVAPQEPVPCCPGYFCPALMTCMIPCPLGAYCPRAWPAPPPDPYKTSIPGKDARWCAPYAYKERPDLGCGGADKWRIIPGSAFPAARWAAGSGSLYCNGGSYCPNTTTILDCPRHHFCRQGETTPARCPPGVSCPPSTEIPESNYSGIAAFVFLLLFWAGSLIVRQYNRILLRLTSRERLRITWGAAPEILVVQTAPRARTPTPTPGSHPCAHTSSSQQASLNGTESAAPGKGLLGMFARRRVGRSAAGDQVWAAFRGPEAEADGFEPLLNGQHTSCIGSGSEAVEMSPSPTGAANAGFSPLHSRLDSIDNEDELTPHHLHSRLVSPHRQSLLSSPLSSLHAGTGIHKREALCIEFRDLVLRLRSCGRKTVLQGVTGNLPACSVTAIMGPSGAGKTSLLNVLSGKAHAYGAQTGSIEVNNHRVPSMAAMPKPAMGFVPQDDIMLSTLTVHENLLFSARYRLPAHFTPQQRLLAVERAIEVLQLEDVRDCQIGNGEKRGISGGQRKRVNVGLELVASPLLLFLDEPTSGLDSSASSALCAALQAVSRSGVTVAAVVHQPSWKVCQMMDQLLLLGKGGRTVYCGSMANAQSYFTQLGISFPEFQNPADSFISIATGELKRPGQASIWELFDAWDEHCGCPAKSAPGPQRSGSGAGIERGQVEDGGSALLGDEAQRQSWRQRFREAALFGGASLAAAASDACRAVKQQLLHLNPNLLKSLFVRHGNNPSPTGLPDTVLGVGHRVVPGFWQQYIWCLGRAVLKRSREPGSILVDYIICALTGMTLGLISDRGRETIMHFAVSITYSVVALGLLSTVGALKTFSQDQVVFYREASSGLNRLAYFLALDTFGHCSTVLRSTLYMATWLSFAYCRAVIWQMLLVAIAIAYCCTGMAYLLSQVMEPSGAQLSAAILALINTLIARQSHPSGIIKVAQSLSFARYGLEGFVVAESNKLTGVWLLARCADLQGLHYDVRNFLLCIMALFSLGIMFRLAALLAMLTLNRDKQL